MTRLTTLILALAAASPALAQSTLILPLPGGGYQIIPPQGFSTQVLPLPGGQGWLILPPPGQGPSTTVLPLPGSAAQQVPMSPRAPCCPGMPTPPKP
jgi:hypothetical protein